MRLRALVADWLGGGAHEELTVEEARSVASWLEDLAEESATSLRRW